MVQLAQSCQADMHRHKAMAINELSDLLTADLLVCTVLLSQSGPDQELSLSWQQTHHTHTHTLQRVKDRSIDGGTLTENM